MALQFTCPSCSRTQENISNRFRGKRIQCPCGQVVRLGPKQVKAPLESQTRASDKSELEETSQPPGGTATPAPFGEHKKKPAIQQLAPPPETVEKMFGKRPPLPRTLHDTPPLNPVGGREDPFRYEVSAPAQIARSPKEQSLFPPLDVPVTVTPFAVSLPGEFVSYQVPVSAYLGLVFGFLGLMQGAVIGLLTLFMMLKLGSLWNAVGQEQLGLTTSVQETARQQVMIDAGLLGILLLLNIGLAIACGIQMISGVFEVRREVQTSRQASINSALIGGLYLVLIVVLAVLYGVTGPQSSQSVPVDFSRESLFGSFLTVMLFLASLALLPTLLVGLGAVRSTER